MPQSFTLTVKDCGRKQIEFQRGIDLILSEDKKHPNFSFCGQSEMQPTVKNQS